MGDVEVYQTIWGQAKAGRDKTSLKALVYAYYKAVNDSRWDDVVNFFHEDGVLLVPSQLPKVGHEKIREFYEYHGAYSPMHHDDIPLLMVDGNHVMTLVDHHGFDKHERFIRLWTGGFFTIEDGRFRQYRVLFDTAQLNGPTPPGVM